MNNRRDWIPTFTGKKVCLNFDQKDISIEDIAHHLSLQCRFAGATERFYSVAQHSFMVSSYVWDETKDVHAALWGLLHDAAEAYLHDINIAVKDIIKTVYGPLEESLLKIIIMKYGLSWPEPDVVKKWDWIIGCNEAFSFMKKGSPEFFGIQPPVQKVFISYWEPTYAEKSFLQNFEDMRQKISNQ